MSQWGGNSNNEEKPTWRWLTKGRGNKLANVFATGKGWVMRWPWGDETLVGIGGLATNLSNATMCGVTLMLPATGYLTNTNSQAIRVRVEFNEAVKVTGTPTITLTGNGTTANVALSINTGLSEPTAGKLVFDNSLVNVASATVGTGWVINSSSVLAGWDGITDALASPAETVANSIMDMTANVVIKQAKPVHTGTLRLGTASNTANQVIGFTLQFNQAVVVTGTPTLTAVGDANAGMNLVCAFTGTGSNTANGTLAFKSAATDFSAKTNECVFTANTTTPTAGFTGIKNDIGGATANALAVANTFTVTTA